MNKKYNEVKKDRFSKKEEVVRQVLLTEDQAKMLNSKKEATGVSYVLVEDSKNGSKK